MEEMILEYEQVRGLRRKFRRYNREFEMQLNLMRTKYMNKLLAQTIENASGRPGPRIVTGQYVSSFYAISATGPGEVLIGIANDSPQTERLEYGFIGTDSLGRNYQQPAFPHMRPALEVVGHEFTEELADLPGKVWESL